MYKSREEREKERIEKEKQEVERLRIIEENKKQSMEKLQTNFSDSNGQSLSVSPSFSGDTVHNPENHRFGELSVSASIPAGYPEGTTRPQMISIPPDNLNRNSGGKKIQQYKRTCKAWGKVWYSLKSREDALKSRSGCGYCCNTCFSGSDRSAQMQAERNKEATEYEITKLLQCPACNSSVYIEEIEDFYG